MDHLSQTFSALADPTRRAILARLSKGEASVSDLARPFLDSMSLPGVTKHLKVLENAGLVTKSRDAQWRPCRLNGPALREAADWMEQYRAFWDESLDRLGEYLASVQQDERSSDAKTSSGPKNAKTSREPARAKTTQTSARSRKSATQPPASPRANASRKGTKNVRKK